MDRRLTNVGYHNAYSSPIDIGDVPIAVSLRDGIIDCMYYGSAVLVDQKGKILWSIGNPDRLVFERSLVKPFKALAVIREGAAKAFSLDEGDIAIIAGSHSGTQAHVARVQALLGKCGLEPHALKCGIRLPLGEDALWELTSNTATINACQCDCSGEHAGVLALCCHLGFPIENYLDTTHPVQKILENILGEFSSVGIQYKPTIIDRCGMPIAAVPLRELASRFLRLITLRQNDKSIDRLINAISTNPYLFTGRGRLLGEIIVRSGGRIIGKDGAEGVYTVAWLDKGVSLTVKVGAGIHKAALPVIEEAARAIGLDFPDVWDCINKCEFAIITGMTDSQVAGCL